jgi:hypothetical protein
MPLCCPYPYLEVIISSSYGVDPQVAVKEVSMIWLALHSRPLPKRIDFDSVCDQ